MSIKIHAFYKIKNYSCSGAFRALEQASSKLNKNPSFHKKEIDIYMNDIDINEVVSDVINYAFGMSMKAIWRMIDAELNFEDKKKYFLEILKILLDRNIVKFGWNGKIIKEESDVLMDRLKKSWPLEQDFDDDEFCTIVPYKIPGKDRLQTHFWIIGDLVWVDDDGEATWSTNAELIL